MLWPAVALSTQGVAVAAYAPYVFHNEVPTFTLTGGNSNTVAFTAKCVFK